MAAPDRIDTLIGAGTRIRGNIAFKGGLRIDGEVTGDVVARPGTPSVLVIGQEGRVHGDLRAPRILINGFVAGSVCATELLELQPCARVEGELRYAGVEIHRDAVIEAGLTHAAPVPSVTAARSLGPAEPALASAANPDSRSRDFGAGASLRRRHPHFRGLRDDRVPATSVARGTSRAPRTGRECR
jgi:cytoskeletal protein CcmA (bactofilin family)